MTKIELEVENDVSEEIIEVLVNKLKNLDLKNKFNLSVTTEDKDVWSYSNDWI